METRVPSAGSYREEEELDIGRDLSRGFVTNLGIGKQERRWSLTKSVNKLSS
jgi:hypothetical protein